MYGRERQYVLSEKIVHDSVRRLQQSNIKNSGYGPLTKDSVNSNLIVCLFLDCLPDIQLLISPPISLLYNKSFSLITFILFSFDVRLQKLVDDLKFTTNVAIRDLELIKQDTVGLRESEKMLRGVRATILRVRRLDFYAYLLSSCGMIAD